MNPEKITAIIPASDRNEVGQALANIPSNCLPALRAAIASHLKAKENNRFYTQPRQIGSVMFPRLGSAPPHEKAMLVGICNVIDSLMKANRWNLIPQYLEIVRVGPKSYIPLNDAFAPMVPVSVIAELEALNAKSDFYEERMEMLGIFASEEYGVSGTLVDEKAAGFNVTRYIEASRASGLDDAEIKKRFRTLFENTWLLQPSGTSLLEHYEALDEHYPGGIKAMLEDMGRITACNPGIREMMERIQKGELPENTREFMAIGAEMVGKIGDSANGFFAGDGIVQRRMVNAVEFHIPASEALAQPKRPTDTNELRGAANRAANFALQMPDHNNFLDTVRAQAFDIYLDHSTDPDAEEIHGYMQAVIERARDLYEAKYGNRHFENEPQEDNDNTIGTVTDDVLRLLDAHLINPDRKTLGERVKLVIEIGFELPVNIAQRCIAYLLDGSSREEAAVVVGMEFPNHEVLRALKVDISDGMRRLLELSRRIKNDNEGSNFLEMADDLDAFLSSATEMRPSIQSEAILKSLDDLVEEGKNKLDGIRARVEMAKKLTFFKGFLSRGLSPASCGIQKTAFLHETNENTKMALSGTILLLSIGAMRLPGLSELLESLEPPKNCANPDELRRHMEQYSDIVRRNMKIATPLLEQRVLEARRQSIGLMPIGGKIHTMAPMDEGILQFMNEIFGFGKTPFRMIHANESLLLPPFVSAYELKMTIAMLESFGIFDRKNPDLQLAVGGRWSPPNAAMAGSSMLLATQAGGTYAKGSFSSTHDGQTGARIMAYDAGVKIDGLPGDLKGSVGRTDILGRQAESDINLYQILGSLAAHDEYGGSLAPIAERYRHELHNTLEKHGLLKTMEMSAWVQQHSQQGDSLEAHERMVNTFGKAWLDALKRQQAGAGLRGTVVGDVSQLIANAIAEIEGGRRAILLSDREAVERTLAY